MRRFLIMSVFMIGALTVGWRYAPDGIRESVLGFAGLFHSGVLTHAVRDAVIPEDPVVRRRSAIDALKQKIGAIREQVETVQNSGDSEASRTTLENVEKAADEAVSIISRLEQANNDQSLGGRVAARVLDAVLPAPSDVQCKDVR